MLTLLGFILKMSDNLSTIYFIVSCVIFFILIMIGFDSWINENKALQICAEQNKWAVENMVTGERRCVDSWPRDEKK